LKEVFALQRDLKLIFFAHFLWDCGHGLYYFILPVYIRGLGATILEVGLFYLLMHAVYFSTMIFGGLLADRFDRKKLALVYWIQTAPAPLVYSVATNWLHLVPGAIFYNFALFSPAIDVYIATAAPRDKVARTFTITQAGYSLGRIFSPLLGAYLLTLMDVRWLLRVAFIFFAMSTVAIAFISPQFPEKRQKSTIRSDFSAVLRNIRVMSWILFFIPVTLVTSMSITFIPTLLEDLYFLKKPVILLMSSIISAGQVVLAAVLGWFGDYYGITRALVAGFALVFVGMILLGFPAFSFLLPLAAFLIGARQVIISLFSSIVAKRSSVHLRGTIFGLYMALIGIGEICGPYVGGLLYESSPTQPFLWSSIFLTLLSLLVIAKEILASKKNDFMLITRTKR
jgi:MFS family permease